MNNFTLTDAQNLEALVEGGKMVASLAYDPLTVTGTPEADMIAAGWTQFYKESSTNLVEVIYTK
jgi:hypothetical protein